MSYNLTSITNAEGLSGYTTAINAASGNLLFSLALVVVFVMSFIAWRNKLTEARNVFASSAITSIFATLFLLQNWISMEIAWICYATIVLSFVYIKIMED